MGIIRAASLRVLGQSSAAVSHTGDTVETALATITIPAGTMGANGLVDIYCLLSNTSNANNKTFRVRFGGASGTVYGGPVTTTQNSTNLIINIGNRNATNSQVGNQGNNIGATAATKITSAVDTTASVDIVISGQCAVGTDTVTLEQYQVVLYPKA